MNVILPPDANPSSELGAAVSAVPGTIDLYRRRDQLRRAFVRVPESTRALAHAAAVERLAAEGAPDGLPADTGADVIAAQDEVRRLAVAEEIRVAAVAQLEHEIADAIREHLDHALDVLRRSLDDVMAQARDAVAQLGDGVTTPERALRGGPAVIAAWQRLDQLSDRYALIRRAQGALYRFAPDLDNPAADQRDHGEVRGRPAIWAGGPDLPPWPHPESDPRTMLVVPALFLWMVRAGVEVWLPTPDELLAAAEGYRHAAGLVDDVALNLHTEVMA